MPVFNGFKLRQYLFSKATVTSPSTTLVTRACNTVSVECTNYLISPLLYIGTI